MKSLWGKGNDRWINYATQTPRDPISDAGWSLEMDGCVSVSQSVDGTDSDRGQLINHHEFNGTPCLSVVQQLMSDLSHSPSRFITCPEDTLQEFNRVQLWMHRIVHHRRRDDNRGQSEEFRQFNCRDRVGTRPNGKETEKETLKKPNRRNSAFQTDTEY